jgi:TRAP-type C4-dicarboxylate transport system substrate-binding protein
MKKLCIAALSLIAVAAVALVPHLTVSKEAEYTVKIGSYVTPQSIWGRVILKTVKGVHDRTGGAVTIKHLHSGMMGSSKNMLDQVLLGGIQAAGIETSVLATMVPEVNIIEMPFLFRDRDEAYYLLDNVINPVLRKKFESKGLITSAIMEVGFMDFVMSGWVHKPEDLKKMKIGSWESPVHMAFWKSQGAVPIPIPATEVFNAYARGMVDSGANTANALVAWDKLFGNGLKRDRIYITRIGFTYQAGILVVNKKFYDSLPAEYRNIFTEELGGMTWNIRNALREAEPGSLKKLSELGYHIGEMSLSEKEVFVRNSRKVYTEMEDKIGKDFLKKVLSEREKYRKSHPVKNSG